MALFFQIIGSIVAAVVVIILAIYMFFRIKFKGVMDMVDSDSPAPLVVHLNESYDSQWLKEPKAEALNKALRSLGFVRDKTYDVIELTGVKLLAYFKDGTSAILYTHPVAGLFVDFVYLGAEGENITVSNVMSGSEIDKRPDCKKIYLPEAGVDELWQRMKTECEGLSESDINPENFREFFEAECQKDAAFIANKGGVTRAEFMRVLRNNPVELSDQKIEEAFLETKLQELEQWHEAVFSAHDLEDYEQEATFFIVPENAHARGFLQYLADYDVIPEEAVAPLGDKYQNTPAPQLFAEINKGFSEKLRATHVTSVELPLKATVFSKPY